MVLFAPPTSEQWYLLLAPFILPLADGTELPPRAGGIEDRLLFGRKMSGNFAQRSLWGAKIIALPKPGKKKKKFPKIYV
jgi:hypothetical protein